MLNFYLRRMAKVIFQHCRCCWTGWIVVAQSPLPWHGRFVHNTIIFNYDTSNWKCENIFWKKTAILSPPHWVNSRSKVLLPVPPKMHRVRFWQISSVTMRYWHYHNALWLWLLNKRVKMSFCPEVAISAMCKGDALSIMTSISFAMGSVKWPMPGVK